MPKITIDIKEKIRSLSKADLEKIVLKLAGKDKSVYDYLLVNYIDTECGEQDLFEEARSDLDILFRKGYKGYSEQLRMANMLAACTKRINEFTRISNNQKLEADLLMYVLDVPFSGNIDIFGTCFTTCDSKTAIMLRRLINVVTTKLHPDYKVDYQEIINTYLEILHRRANHLNIIYTLPKSI